MTQKQPIIAETIKKYQINSGGSLTFHQILKHPKRDELIAAWNGPGGKLESLKSMECFGILDVDPKSIPDATVKQRVMQHCFLWLLVEKLSNGNLEK